MPEKNSMTGRVVQQQKALIDPITLASRVEHALLPTVAVQKRMFGGVAFLINGNMLAVLPNLA